jgi:hypothetical protein
MRYSSRRWAVRRLLLEAEDLRAGQRAFRLALGATLHRVPDYVGQLGGSLAARFQVQPVARFGEAQIRIHAGHDDTYIDLEDLDPDERDTNEGIDDEPPVENELKDVVEISGTAPAVGGVALLHETHGRSSFQ